MTSFGASLRRERELRGVSLQQIAVGTKIGVRLLQAIEEDRLDKLPQGLFVRGFIREYARFLGLDEQKILTELSFHVDLAPAPPPRFEEPAPKISSRLATRLANAALAVSVFAIVGALIMSPGFQGRASPPTTLPPVQLPPEAARTDSPILTSSDPSVVALEPDAAAGVGIAIPTASVLPQPLQLTLTATEDCWIGLDVGGDRVENRVLRKGESFSITARQNASLAVGNAGGLLVAIDSGPARPLGNRGEVKRNIPLSPEALGALSAGSQASPPKPIG